MSYSHPATKQDIWVLEKLGLSGTFAEVGAYDGLKHSNTRLLEEFGWTGCLVEGHSPYADLCRANRPGCEVHDALIGDGRTVTFIVGGQYSGILSNMSSEFAEEHQKRCNLTYLKVSQPLAKVIGLKYDYLSIDTEGGEFDILYQWFMAGGRARAITVEYRFDLNERTRLEWLMADQGMYLDDVRGFDLCFLEDK